MDRDKNRCVLRPEDQFTLGAPSLEFETSPRPSSLVKEVIGDTEEDDEEEEDDTEHNDDDDSSDDFEIILETLDFVDENHLQYCYNHHLKLDQNQESEVGSSLPVSTPTGQLSNATESNTERSNNDFDEHADLLQSTEENNSEIPELAQEKHLQSCDNHRLYINLMHELDTDLSSQVSSPRELLSNATESNTERSNNDFDEHADLLQSTEENNSEIPELAQEKHLQSCDNHRLYINLMHELDTDLSSQVSSPRELLSNATESNTERSNNDFDEHVDLLQSTEENNSEIPELVKEKHLPSSDIHHTKSDQQQELEAGPSSQVSGSREQLSNATESNIKGSNNDCNEHVDLLQSTEENNSEIPELVKEKHLPSSDIHHTKSDQQQELEAGPSSQVSGSREQLSNATESNIKGSNNDCNEHVDLLQSTEENNSEIPELAQEKHLQSCDNHRLYINLMHELDTDLSSQVSSPRELLSNATESNTERSNNDFDEHVDLLQSTEENNSEIPELVKEKHLPSSDIHHTKSDQQQELEAGPSSQVSGSREQLSNATESNIKGSNNDCNEHVDLLQSTEENNSEIPELVKEKHLPSSDIHHTKSDQQQELEAGPSSQVSGSREQLSNATESNIKGSNNDCNEHVDLLQSTEENNSEIPELVKEKHLPSSDIHHTKSDQQQELEAGPSSQVSSPRDRPSVFINNILGDTQPYVRRHEEIRRLKISFGEHGYVDGKWMENRLIELYSCQFTHPLSNKTVYIRKQHPGYLFTFDEDDFIARVNCDKLKELNFVEEPVENTQKNFLKKLIIIKIIQDKAIICRDAAYMQFMQFLKDRSVKTAETLQCAEDIFQLSVIFNGSRICPAKSILDNIVNNKYISSDFKRLCLELINREKALDERREDFSQLDEFKPKHVFSELYEIYLSAEKYHKTSLLDKCYSSFSHLAYSINWNINSLSEPQVFYISNQDINLFCDLANEMNDSYSIFFLNLQKLLFSKVMMMKKHISVKELAPLTHPIYFYLCKHIRELILEISGKTDMSVNDLLKIDKDGKMVLATSINWPTSSPLNQCLEQQYRFVFKLMKHFEPVYNIKQKFVYRFKSSKASGRSFWKCIKGWFVSDKLPGIPENRLVWMYILDNSMTKLFPPGSQQNLDLFQPLLEGYMCFIQIKEEIHYESFRIMTYNIIRFIAQTIPYLSEKASEIDRVTLTNQITSIQYAISNKQLIDFKDLVDVYNKYWKNRDSLIEKIPDKFPYGKFKSDMEIIRQKLYSIINTVLRKEVKSQALINFFRSFNEFLEDLSATEFSWFIKESSDVTPKEYELVNANKKSYKVLDPENFIKKHGDIPGHYLIEIIDDLLNTVSNLLEQEEWSNYDRVNAANELVLAIKKSLLYLKEQPDYVSFDTFKEESTQPFACVVENSSSYEDFVNRVNIIGESFWYLRKQDEIDIKKALMLYKQENENITTETEDKLIDCYNKYLNKFNSYIQLTCNQTYLDKIEFIVKDVKDQLQLIEIDEWRENFKLEALPELVAGLAAVWSIQTSKDIIIAKKILKPHCIQVLCIFLLLSVDKCDKGVEKRLAQVLTGQGKSLIIGLTATLFALMSYKVKAVCYSTYLAIRDQENFNNFFKVFGVKHNITYQTFDNMALEILFPIVNGTRQTLGELVEDRIRNHNKHQVGELNHDDRSKTILFIDEVDVFFSPNFYGNCYSAIKKVNMPALIGIQEYIWEMASKNYERSIILNEVEEFIKKKIIERNKDFIEFKKFLVEPGDYYLLSKEIFGAYDKKLYTNQSLYEEQRNSMIDNAILVARASDTDSVRSHFQINDCGKITCKNSYDSYDLNVVNKYLNMFNYFRLKKKNYSTEGFHNYGYFMIYSGIISYAKLPEEYPLILGVSGTLSKLNRYERDAIKNTYSIHENCIMPSYYGKSNLQFDTYHNFICETSEEQWLSKIHSSANSKIASGRSVIIFFNQDIEIDKFKKEFCNKYDRIHTLDENTQNKTKQKYIDEAGIAETVTLATRNMGRGVDFKSSVAVEKNGGLHVIQTFMSLDIKEETQIKGRTARKDNKGSYELIVCKVHLIEDNLLPKDGQTVVCYGMLDKSRKELQNNKCLRNEHNIKTREAQHTLTMEFFKSFFKKPDVPNIVEQPFEENTGDYVLT